MKTCCTQRSRREAPFTPLRSAQVNANDDHRRLSPVQFNNIMDAHERDGCKGCHDQEVPTYKRFECPTNPCCYKCGNLGSHQDPNCTMYPEQLPYPSNGESHHKRLQVD